MFGFVFVELLVICSSLFTDTDLQVHLGEMCFDLGAKGGETSEVYYLVTGSISQF